MSFETKMKMELIGWNEEERGIRDLQRWRLEREIEGGEYCRERERGGLNNQRGREKERRLVTCAEIVSHD